MADTSVMSFRCTSCTWPHKEDVFTFATARSSPWMILAIPTSRPSTWDSARVSNAITSLSFWVSLFL